MGSDLPQQRSLRAPHSLGFSVSTSLENTGHPAAPSQEFQWRSSAPSRHTEFSNHFSRGPPRLTYQTPAAPTGPRTLPLPACQRQRGRASRHVPQVAPAPAAPRRVPAPSAVRKEAGPGTPASRPTQAKEKRDAPESPLAKSGRRIPSLPVCSSQLGSPPGTLETRPRSEVHPGAAATVPLRLAPADQGAPDPRALERVGPGPSGVSAPLRPCPRVLAEPARASRVPAPPSPAQVPDPG